MLDAEVSWPEEHATAPTVLSKYDTSICSSARPLIGNKREQKNLFAQRDPLDQVPNDAADVTRTVSCKPFLGSRSLSVKLIMQSPRKPDLLTPLVNDIDRLRREWGIKGVSITVVNQDPGDDFNDWKTEFLGLGVRDGEGNPVDEHVGLVLAL